MASDAITRLLTTITHGGENDALTNISSSSTGSDPHDVCDIAEQEIKDVVMGFVLTVGVIISYSFQWCAIARAGSSHTLSYWNLFLACVENANVVYNAFILTFYDRMQCCVDEWGPWKCYKNISGFVTFGATLLWHIPVYGLYVAYIGEQTVRDARRARILFGVLIAYNLGLCGMAAGFVLDDVHGDASEWIARASGVIALGLTVVVWTPQLIHTYRAKTVGALSIPMLVLQAPGAAMFAYFQAGPQGTGPTTYLPACSIALQQFVLLFLCIHYWRQERKAIAHLEAASRGLLDEDTANPYHINSQLVGNTSNPLPAPDSPKRSLNHHPRGGAAGNGSRRGSGVPSNIAAYDPESGLLQKNHPHSGSWHRQPNEDDEMDD